MYLLLNTCKFGHGFTMVNNEQKLCFVGVLSLGMAVPFVFVAVSASMFEDEPFLPWTRHFFTRVPWPNDPKVVTRGFRRPSASVPESIGILRCQDWTVLSTWSCLTMSTVESGFSKHCYSWRMLQCAAIRRYFPHKDGSYELDCATTGSWWSSTRYW